MRVFQFIFMICAFWAAIAAAQTTSIPDIVVETSFASEGPLSLYSIPDGSGLAFTEAYHSGGQHVDGTLTMVLYADSGFGLEAIANFPFEDIWLEVLGSDLAPCTGGTSPDTSTDAAGATSWITPLELGGRTNPGEVIWIVVNGDFVDGGALPDFQLNSPDIDGNRQVNLSDVQLFAIDFYGAYGYRSDFVWDGIVNLSDIVPLARAMGANCP
jgi:hypothetical protein